jgi:hypothetical protein
MLRIAGTLWLLVSLSAGLLWHWLAKQIFKIEFDISSHVIPAQAGNQCELNAAGFPPARE